MLLKNRMQLLKLLTICLNRIFALQKISNLFSFRKNFLICGKKKKRRYIPVAQILCTAFFFKESGIIFLKKAEFCISCTNLKFLRETLNRGRQSYIRLRCLLLHPSPKCMIEPFIFPKITPYF